MAKRVNHEVELARLGDQLAEAQARVDALRSKVDTRLAHWHAAGVPIVALARATGLSRETVYKAINRAPLGS